MYDVIILGSGPAGLTSAIYSSRAGMKTLVIAGAMWGGQLMLTREVENFPGFENGILGPTLMEQIRNQAERWGAELVFEHATVVDFKSNPFKVNVGNKVYEAKTIILATGASAKWLGLESETRLRGRGVSVCATCDAPFFRNKKVVVVGGGDTAAEEATYLAGLCKKVYMVVRRDELRASKAMQKRVFNSENIEVLWKHQTKELLGNQVVTGVELYKNKGEANEETVKIDIDGFFLAIGHTPNSEVFKEYLNMDETGYVNTIPGTSKTNVPGIFACGDLQDKTYRQAVTAAGTGCMAALDAERYLGESD